MATQLVPASGKKKVRWLLLPFFIIGVLIIISFVPFHKIFSGSISTSLMPSTGLSAKISPEEMALMANNFSVDYVAGECTNKGFVEFEETWTFNDSKVPVYCYYYGGKITDKRKAYYGESYYNDRITEMTERIVPVQEGYIYYTIKDKNSYEGYISYVKSHCQDSITGSNKIYPYPHYVFNNAVFIDCNYLRGFNGYCMEVYPLSKFTTQRTANIDSIARIKTLLSKQDSVYNDKLQGLWKGTYNDKNISLAILNIANDTVYGYSSVAGNFSSFAGNITPGNSGYNLELREKDAKLNGIFHITFDSTENTMAGKWASYDSALNGELKLSRAVPGDSIKIIADKAFVFSEHEYKTQTRAYFSEGDHLQYDSLSTIFIHCTYNNGVTETSGWVLIKKIEFL